MKTKKVECQPSTSSAPLTETLDIVGAILSGKPISTGQSYELVKKPKEGKTKPASSIKTYENLKMNKEKSKLPMSIPKRQSKSSEKVLLYPAKADTKIPSRLRCECLHKLYNEMLLKKSKNEAQAEASKIELEICKKTNSSIVYRSLIVSHVKSMRSGPSTAPVTSTQITKLPNNCSIVKRAKITYHDLSEEQRADVLNLLTIPIMNLSDYGFPRIDEETGQVLLPVDAKKKLMLVDYHDGIVTLCDRCSKHYTIPQVITDEVKCIYHPGKLFRRRSRGQLEFLYTCCEAESDSVGCKTAPYHVTFGYEFRSSRTGFLKTLPTNGPPKVYALDCEMV